MADLGPISNPVPALALPLEGGEEEESEEESPDKKKGTLLACFSLFHD